MIALDTSALLLLLYPLKPAPVDPTTALPVHRCHERLTHLVKSLSERRVKIALPTPVIAEYLIGVGADKQSHLAQLQSSAPFLPLPFDEKAAIEHACITEPSVKPGETKAKLRFDRQIIAIAKAHGANTLFTADGNQAEFAKTIGLSAVLIHEIPLPPPETAPLFGAE